MRHNISGAASDQIGVGYRLVWTNSRRNNESHAGLERDIRREGCPFVVITLDEFRLVFDSTGRVELIHTYGEGDR
jgi:hypothetical protein